MKVTSLFMLFNIYIASYAWFSASYRARKTFLFPSPLPPFKIWLKITILKLGLDFERLHEKGRITAGWGKKIFMSPSEFGYFQLWLQLQMLIMDLCKDLNTFKHKNCPSKHKPVALESKTRPHQGGATFQLELWR